MPECLSDCQRLGSFLRFLLAASLVWNILGDREHQFLTGLSGKIQKLHYRAILVDEFHFSSTYLNRWYARSWEVSEILPTM